jgi:hypothetical protein
MIVMQSMELSDEQKLDAVMPMPMPDKPEYPYGLCICLTQAEFDKLGLDPDDAQVGGLVHGHFMARITSVSSRESDGDSDCRVEMQIEDLAIESEDAENEDEPEGT